MEEIKSLYKFISAVHLRPRAPDCAELTGTAAAFKILLTAIKELMTHIFNLSPRDIYRREKRKKIDGIYYTDGNSCSRNENAGRVTARLY